VAELYRLPKLEPWGWRTAGQPLPPSREALGADLDQGMVYLLGAKSEVLALDLETARVRPAVASGVRAAALGPDGTLFTVNDSEAVTALIRRNPMRLQGRLPALPRDLFGTKRSDILAITTGRTTTLTGLRSDGPPSSLPIPSGDAAASLWGDLIAVAADTAVILIDPDDPSPSAPISIPVSGHARAVLFSPSGHRIYVARREGPIVVFNRFTGERVGDIHLPGPASALRADPYGRWVLVHPASADSVWLVDAARDQMVTGFATAWSRDLPTVTNQGVLLVKSGADLVAYDLTRPKWPETGRVRGGAKDFWLPLAWSPETGTSSDLTDLTPQAAVPQADTGRPAGVYLQVSSSQNRAWSAELAKQLADAGLPARVLDPKPTEEGFRVVLGPYSSREAAESVGRKLGRPFFVYQPDR
jgi:hypothetical protein